MLTIDANFKRSTTVAHHSQKSVDCNWSPGNYYTGNTVFGLENPYSADDFYVHNVADGVRMP